jgi:HSP20 family protein
MKTSQTTTSHTTQERAERTRSGPTYRPNVDIFERPDELVMLVDLPGCQGDQIDVRFEDGELTIQASVEPRQAAGTRYLLREYGVGDFYRTFRVSEQIDSQRMHASYALGVLTLHLPKVQSAQPRKIPVAVGG